MSKALFEISGTSNSLKPLLSGTRSSDDVRNALGALHQTDFAPLRARGQGWNTLEVWVNPAIIENYYMPVLNVSGVPCTYASGVSPATWVPDTNPRIDILHINAAEPNPTLFWVSGTQAASPAIPSLSSSGTPICAVYHTVASNKILSTNDAVNSYIYRDMRPLYSSISPTTTTITGEMRMWAGAIATPPTGWLICDGSAISRTTYSGLFTVIGTVYGVGNGSTTFNIPNFTNVFPYGANEGSSAGNASVGATGGNLTLTGNDSSIIGKGSDPTNISSQTGLGASSDVWYEHKHESMPPYLAVGFIIKT